MNVVSYVTKKAAYISHSTNNRCFLFANFAILVSEDILQFRIIPYDKLTVTATKTRLRHYRYFIGKSFISDFLYVIEDGYNLPGNVEAGYYHKSKEEDIYMVEIPELKIKLYSIYPRRIIDLCLLLRQLGANVNIKFPTNHALIFLNDLNLGR